MIHGEELLSLGQPLRQGNKLPNELASFSKSRHLHFRLFGHILFKRNTMKIKNKETELFEYKFHYHLGDDLGSADKYFLAHDRNEASDMFCYACNKNRLDLHDVHISRWNRWKGAWEVLNSSPSCSIALRN